MENDTRRYFHLPSEPIGEDQINETYTTDVVVAGAGTSGKAAALSAAEAGARVIQIDKHVTYRWGGGMIGAIDSRLQKQHGVTVDKDEVCLQLMRWCGNKPDQKLYRVWTEQSAAVVVRHVLPLAGRPPYSVHLRYRKQTPNLRTHRDRCSLLD